MPTSSGARDALRRAGELGGFFAVETEPGTTAWLPFTRLLEPSGQLLPACVERTRTALAARAGIEPRAVEQRVAASLWFLGWAGRLVSPWLGAGVLTGRVPVGDAESIRWQDSPHQPVPLAVVEPRATVADPADPDELAAALHDHCVRPLVEPLLAATDRAYSVSDQVLWGNVASAVAGAAATLARAEPARGPAARATAAQLLTIGSLSGRGSYGTRFRRRSCCLLYRVPAAGLCSDCVLAAQP